VTDRRRLAPGAGRTAQVDALVALLREAADAGVDLIQIREPDLPARIQVELARQVVDHVRAADGRTRVLVNDRADVAAASGASGVHLPSHGISAAATRRLDNAWSIGRSVHDGFDPSDGVGADYLLFGTVFGSVSKPSVAPAGLRALSMAAARSGCPVLAIGGVTPARASGVIAAGAAGVAAIGVFLPPGCEPQALGPAAAVRQFRSVFRAASPARLC
jgi:thiamine-phosphate diphosphorylase